jgi:hypothetical protein
VFAVEGTAQTAESVRLTIVLFAIVFVVFWKTLLKITVMVAATTVIVLLASGVVEILQNIHHVAR